MVMSRILTFLSVLRFFGLTSNYRKQLFSHIHEIVFYGKGGYDYYTIYNMPIWLRNFTFQKVNEHYQKEQEAYDKANKKGTTVIDRSGIVKDPSVMRKSSNPQSKRVTY
jgi:hypothetical protein